MPGCSIGATSVFQNVPINLASYLKQFSCFVVAELALLLT